ncbi:MAG: DNA-3-methyladenine glycosylase I [Ruminococcaceae bacterium]|nr:DNA-3-methyladenine glycosylase I [Oscillospiraceae bacterium]
MRCKWCNEKNPLYVKYHDEEWGKPRFDDPYLFEMLILESFQAGLSWECVLNKRESFRRVFEGFEPERIMSFDEDKINLLKADKGIIRNERKIRAAISNARIFREIVNEYGSFYNYLCLFWSGEQIEEVGKVTSPLSDAISRDLIKRGMKFCGSVIIYSYLQAVGVIDSHDEGCGLNEDNSEEK